MTSTSKIYFDYNATTPMSKKALEAFCEASVGALNPSSIHSIGREAKKKLRDAREKILKNLGAEGATIIFTSCGTEANNTILKGFKSAERIAVSSVEHVSILKLAEKLNAKILPVEKNGLVKIDELQNWLLESDKRPFVSIIYANNETGVIQDFAKIKELVFANGGFIHSDASQIIGKESFDFNNSGLDAITISGHKFGAGKGVAALIIKKGIELEPLLYGGGQEGYLRGGTENLSAIVAMSVAIEESVANLNNYKNKISILKNKLENAVKEKYPDSVTFGENSERLVNTSYIAIPNMKAESRLINLDLAGICASSGSACSSGRVNSSHVLAAMGVEPALAQTAIRISLGFENSEDEIDRFLEVL